jgi:uncharacterized membrane-anchored protein YjiN (DUF445 family)
MSPDPGRPSFVDQVADAPRRRARLRRMKALALSLLIATAVLYGLTYLVHDGDRGWVGFVRAGAEAGIVGGLADWFAVTALFRRPLGLPIPHTALIPTRKDALAGTLGEFVTGNFVTPDNLRLQLADARPIGRMAGWLLAPGRAEALVGRALSEVGAVRGLLRPEAVADVLLDVIRRDAGRRSYAEVLGALLEDFTDSGQHRPLLDAALPYLREGLSHNRPVVQDLLRTLADDRLGVLAWFVSDKRLASLLDGVEQTLGDMATDQSHPVRLALDQLLASVATDLQGSPELRDTVDGIVARFLDDEQTRAWWVRVAEGGLSAVQSAVADPGGPFAAAAVRALIDLGHRAQQDVAFAAGLAARLEDLVVAVVERYGAEVTRLIERTIKGWDGADAADKIELAAGRDLQFIRVNGTVVGALAGLAIHALALL